MNSPTIKVRLALAVIAPGVMGASAATSSARPNILFIVSDDLNAGESTPTLRPAAT